MIERGEVNGQDALLSYVDANFVPVKRKSKATIVVAWLENGRRLVLMVPQAVRDASWREEDHPRGQPENKGQFGPGGGGSSKSKSAKGKRGKKPKRPVASEKEETAAQVLAAASSRRELIARAAKAGRSPREQIEHEIEVAMEKTARARDKERAAMREANARTGEAVEAEAQRVAENKRLAERMRSELAQRRGELGLGPNEEQRQRAIAAAHLTVSGREAAAAAAAKAAAREPTGAEMMAEAERLRAEREEREAAEAKGKPKEIKPKRDVRADNFLEAGIRFNSYGDENAALEDWNRFVGMSPADFKREFMGGLEGNMRISADPDQDIFNVNGEIEGDEEFEGEVVGEFDRNLNFSKKEGYSALFQVNESAQKHGYGRRASGWQYQDVRAIRIQKVNVTAGLKVGAYAWAKYGYIPKQDDWDMLREKLKYKAGSGGAWRARVTHDCGGVRGG